MGDNDGSSTAAQSARQTADVNHGDGIFRRVFNVFRPATDTGTGMNGAAAPQVQAPPPSLMNLRRMRVEDVAIPKADIVAVPDTITKPELVQVFRESGMTRLPVYSGTLDTPVGMAHLKDFALRHGFNGSGQRFDLKKMLRSYIQAFNASPLSAVLPSLAGERAHNPELAKLFEPVSRARRGALLRAFERAVARGEIPESTDLELAGDLVVGPIAVSLFFKGGRLSTRKVGPMVDLALAGIRAQADGAP